MYKDLGRTWEQEDPVMKKMFELEYGLDTHLNNIR